MTRREAITALGYWSHPSVVPAYIIEQLEAAAIGDERPLDTATRLACGRVIRIAPQDFATVRRLVAIAEVELARDEQGKRS